MEQVKRFFDRDTFAKALGIELVEVQPGRALARMRLREDHLNGFRIAHGGATFALADLAFAAASNSHGTVAVAICATIAYFKAVGSGMLTAEAKEVSRSPKLATYEIRVRDEGGDTVAAFQGTVYRKKESLADAQAEAPGPECGAAGRVTR